MIAYLIVMNVGSYPIAELPDSLWEGYHMGDVVDFVLEDNVGSIVEVSDTFSVIKVTDATEEWLLDLVEPGFVEQDADSVRDPNIVYPKRRNNVDVDALYGVLPENRFLVSNSYDIETDMASIIVNSKVNRTRA